MTARRIAALDVGTNTILLLIADVGPGGDLTVVCDRARIEGLGRGVDRTGELAPDAIARGLAALAEYADVIREARVDHVAAVGTQALREARNGQAFLGRAHEILGVPVEVIDGRREAELAFAAVRCSFPTLATGEVVVCDVGGGSTELIHGRAGRVERLVSLPIGSVRMTERFLHGDPATREEAAAMIAAIDEALAAAPLPAGTALVGTAGTVTTLAAVAMGLVPYDPDRVHGMSLPRLEVERQLARYLELTLTERKRLPGLEPKRADTIVGGAAIVARVLARLGVDRMVVSDRGVRWGLAVELAERAGG